MWWQVRAERPRQGRMLGCHKWALLPLAHDSTL